MNLPNGFNALHGKYGEDGCVQGLLNILGIPYTHSGVISSYNAMNKVNSKMLFLKNKIKTPKFISINRSEFNKNLINKIINKKKN